MDTLRQFSAWQIATLLFFALLIFIEIGYRLGTHFKKNYEESSTAFNTIKGAALALLGLILGFSFAISSGRFEQRRHLKVQENNAIGTAYLRGDFMEEPLKSRYRDLLRAYTDDRIAAFQAKAILDEAEWNRFKKAQALQNEIWKTGMEYALTHPQAASTILLITSLNQLIDISTERAVARIVELPLPIIFLLFCIVLISGLLIGHSFGMAKQRNWSVTLLFSLLICLVVYIVIDLDQPRRGLIQDKTLLMEHLRSTMK